MIGLRALAFLGGLVAMAPLANAADPITIHIGTPDSSVNGTPSSGINPTTMINVRHLLEQEFDRDGIKVEWTYFKGAGPAVNEALANKQLDFVNLGDLAHIIGRASGLDTRLLVGTRGSNAFLVATPDSGINSLADLKGKHVAVFKGTAYQLSFDRALTAAKMSERDMQVINLDWNAAAAAIAAHQIDATWTNTTGLALRDKGVAKLVTSTKQLGRAATFSGGLAGREEFIKAHPDLTARLVKVFVANQAYLSDPARENDFIDQTSKLSGVPAALGHGEYDDTDLRFRFSPRLDAFEDASFQSSIDQAKELGLIRKSYEAKDWFDPTFVEQAIRDLHLEKQWPLYDKEGNPVAG